MNSSINQEFFIVGLDQRKLLISSQEYLCEVLKVYGFKEDFIRIIKLLYAESTVQVNVNGVLTEGSEIKRRVKQGCPLSAALYILAINPLLKMKIKGSQELRQAVVSVWLSWLMPMT